MHSVTINEQILTPLIGEVLQREKTAVVTWQQTALQGGTGDLGAGLVGVYHFYGQARDGDTLLPWSLVLKSIQVAEGQEHASYLKREWLAYHAHVLASLTGPVVAPRCLATTQQPGNQYWIWLEYLVDDYPQPWSLEHYATAAHHFGQWNGHSLTGEPLPDIPWFCHSTAREWTAQAAPEVDFLRTVLDHPLVQLLYPQGQAERILQLWDERERFFQALERLPQTICHNDVFRRNLFGRHNPKSAAQTVAIDWANLGWGAIGEEVAAMVVGNLGFDEVDWALAAEFTTLMVEGYLNGLRAAGWTGDPRLVRLGFTAAAAMKYCFPYVLQQLFSAEQESWRRQVLEESSHNAFAAAVRKHAFVFALADEARMLMNKLRLA
ncbi:MAG: hypothetical protein R3E79_25380 [Caldilineaceae bacterium]